MATDKRVFVLRADEEEEKMIAFLLSLRGGSASRLLGQAVRELARREGWPVGGSADMAGAGKPGGAGATGSGLSSGSGSEG